ncbi:YegP family protein [Kitasatospora sp. NPDC101801]|uniref:YegP family protein n=1 Tax=Kitasatospora sp. NPDC101801 TaxID=3364103 RepID=UPI0037F6376A
MAGQRVRDDGVAEPVRRGSVQAERDVNGRYRWSLKAPNGRIVAVSASVYETPELARQVFEGLRGAAPGLVVRITHVRDGIGWIWVVPGPRGVPDARSHRTYERYATCQNAFRRFVALLERSEGVEISVSRDGF